MRQIAGDTVMARREYDRLKRWATGGKIDTALAYACNAAVWAWQNLPGYFRDDELEQQVAQLGRRALEEAYERPNLPCRPVIPSPEVDVLMVVSTLAQLGGHSTLALNWLEIMRQAGYRTAFISTEIAPSSVDREHIIRHAAPAVFMSSGSPFSQRILQLREAVETLNPRLLVLCINPQDVIAVGALSNLRHKPKTLCLNHADHCFWIGARLADRVVDYRQAGVIYTTDERQLPSTRVPLMCKLDPQPLFGRAQVRAELGMPADATLSLSLATVYKILGGGGWQYLDSVARLLQANPTHHHLLIVNDQEAEIDHSLKNSGVYDRFYVSGMKPHAQLSSFYQAADFLIETFPLIGATVRMEAMGYGLPLLVPDHPDHPENTEMQGLPLEYPIARSQAEWLALGRAMVTSGAARRSLGAECKALYEAEFSADVVTEKIRTLLAGMLDELDAPWE